MPRQEEYDGNPLSADGSISSARNAACSRTYGFLLNSNSGCRPFHVVHPSMSSTRKNSREMRYTVIAEGPAASEFRTQSLDLEGQLRLSFAVGKDLRLDALDVAFHAKSRRPVVLRCSTC